MAVNDVSTALDRHLFARAGERERALPRALVWTDRLIPIRTGRSVRFPLDQLERFVAERTVAEEEVEFPGTA